MTPITPGNAAALPPNGTVTLLFTDIEGSTRLWETQERAMRAALARHDMLLRRTIDAHGGHVFKTVGDAFCAAFHTASDGVAAAGNVPELDGNARFQALIDGMGFQRTSKR